MVWEADDGTAVERLGRVGGPKGEHVRKDGRALREEALVDAEGSIAGEEDELPSSSQKSTWRVNCSWPWAGLRGSPGTMMVILFGLAETRRRLVERESRAMSQR